MLTAIIDYDSGNLHSAEKAFQRMAQEVGAGEVLVTSDADVVARADRIVLPGDGAFPACAASLRGKSGLFEALQEAVAQRGRPFLGICVGMQLMASIGREYQDTQGLDWIGGEVKRITPSDPRQKVPHMGWNELVVDHQHPVFDGLEDASHVYFVHSYHFVVRDDANRMAHVDYFGDITAVIARDTMLGMQFHPEKSQATGLRMIANFLLWSP